MIDTEVVAQDHLDGFEMQGLVGGVDMGEVYHRDVPHNLLMEMADFEIGEVGNQNLKVHAADTCVHSFVLFHLSIRKQLIDKRFVHAAVRCARIQNNADFLPRHRPVQQRVIVALLQLENL